MTPKEKAKELFKRFTLYTLNDMSDENFEETRGCVLILIECMINEHIHNYTHSWNVERKKYWNQVKIEVNKP